MAQNDVKLMFGSGIHVLDGFYSKIAEEVHLNLNYAFWKLCFFISELRGIFFFRSLDLQSLLSFD